jgi:hypothetical protein
MRYSFKSLAVVELVHLLEDPDEIVRAGAACEIGRRGRQAVTAIPALVDMARLDEDGPARGAAGSALVALAKARTPGTIDAARRATKLGYYPLTARAAWVLERIEAAAW